MPYVLLAVVGFVVLIFAFSRVRARPLVAALVGMAASLGLSDWVASGVLRLYTFRPYVFTRIRADNGLGVLLADFIFVPFVYASLVLLIPRYRLLVTAGFVALLSGIEITFAYLGIFVQHAWSFWYTPLLFAARCGLAIWWLGIFESRGYTRGFRWLIVSTSLSYLWWLWVVITGAIMSLWEVRLGLLDPFPDVVLASFLLHGIPYLILAIGFVLVRDIAPIYRWAILVGTLTLFLSGLEAAGLWQDRAPWSPLVNSVILGTLTLAVVYLDQWMGSTSKQRIKAR